MSIAIRVTPEERGIADLFGIPFLAMARFAVRSPTELPNANTVRPNTVEWTLLTTPMNSRQFTRRPAMTSMYVAATKKPYREIGTCKR